MRNGRSYLSKATKAQIYRVRKLESSLDTDPRMSYATISVLTQGEAGRLISYLSKRFKDAEELRRKEKQVALF